MEKMILKRNVKLDEIFDCFGSVNSVEIEFKVVKRKTTY